ncbi:MAG: DNA alkylation repair protein [Candidatus Magnetoovum sp. WYHC-5]|nr:DNA alkylation repair protein [Candidatus Magnetoovum sp. WYHC-5]
MATYLENTSIDVERQYVLFKNVFLEHYNSQRAKKEKAYLKSPFEFYGVSVPFTTKMASTFRRANKSIEKVALMALIEKLWNSTNHNEKTLAVKLLMQYPSSLDDSTLSVLEKMLNESTGWDHVDEIAIHIVGAILEKGDAGYEYLERWSVCENFWLRRASLISQILLFRRGKGKPQLFFQFARKMLKEKEFFIKKAIGWTIREIAKGNRELALDFVESIKGEASKLTIREALKGCK